MSIDSSNLRLFLNTFPCYVPFKKTYRCNDHDAPVLLMFESTERSGIILG